VPTLGEVPALLPSLVSNTFVVEDVVCSAGEVPPAGDVEDAGLVPSDPPVLPLNKPLWELLGNGIGVPTLGEVPALLPSLVSNTFVVEDVVFSAGEVPPAGDVPSGVVFVDSWEGADESSMDAGDPIGGVGGVVPADAEAVEEVSNPIAVVDDPDNGSGDDPAVGFSDDSGVLEGDGEEPSGCGVWVPALEPPLVLGSSEAFSIGSGIGVGMGGNVAMENEATVSGTEAVAIENSTDVVCFSVVCFVISGVCVAPGVPYACDVVPGSADDEAGGVSVVSGGSDACVGDGPSDEGGG